MKKLIFILSLTLAAAAGAALPDERTLLAIGRAEGAALAPLKLEQGEAEQAARGLRDYLTIKDNSPREADVARAHELIAARQEAAGRAGAGQGSPAEWNAALYAYGQEAGMRLYAGGFSKDETAVLARGFAETLRGAPAPDMAREGAAIRALMAARAEATGKEQKAFFEKMSREPGAVKTASGGLFIPRKEGDGPAPKPYCWVKAAVSIKLWNGKPQGGGDKGDKESQLPEAGFITDALLRMKAGGRATLVTPAGLDEGRMPVSAVELELISVREGEKPEEPAPPAAEPRPEDAGEPAGERTVEELVAEYNRTGSPAAALAIGTAYKDGSNGADADAKKAFVWFSRAAAKKNAGAAFLLGRAYANGDGTPGSRAEAAKWYAKASEWGSTEGAVAMADCYRFGWGVKANDREALNWYLKAAGADSATWKEIARLYMFPANEADRNYAEALRWYTRIHEETGDPAAANGIGNVYRLGGPGVNRNPEKALEWYKKGAEAGDTLSMRYLSEAYERGEGAEADPAAAYKWYLVYMAKERVGQPERDKLKQLEAKLAPAQKAAAREEARALTEKLVSDKDREDKAYLESLPGN